MNFLNAAASLSNQFNNNKNNEGAQNNVNLSGLGNLLSAATGGNSNNENTSDQQNDKNQDQSKASGIDLSTLGSLLNMVPHEKQKQTLVDHIAPLVKMISPKWGDVIVGILRNLELEKLLAITKDEKELTKAVKEEERKLESESS